MAQNRLNREAVVSAAEALVDLDGWAYVTMTQLADRLGVRGPTLYSHVESLDALLGLVQIRALAELGADLQRSAMGKSGADGVRALASALRSFATRHPGRYELAMSEPIDRPALQVAGADAGAAFSAVVQSLGAPVSVELAFSCLSTLHGVLVLDRAGLFRGNELDIEAVYERATELVVHTVEHAADA